MDKQKIVLIAIFVTMGVIFVCGIIVLWPQLFPPDIEQTDYMNGKMIVAWTQDIKSDVLDPLNPKKTIRKVWHKICFVASGDCFPEGDIMAEIIGTSETCGEADGAMDFFKVFDAMPGGIMRWSYRGYMPMGSKECPVGDFVPYPKYNPDLDPEGFVQKLAKYQECWVYLFDSNGLMDRVRCGMSQYLSYPNIKAVSPPGRSAEVFHFVVMSDDGVSKVPFSLINEISAQGGLNINVASILDIIKQINANPDNPAFQPIWNWKK